MASQQEREELKRQLTEDVVKARQTVESAGESRGVSTTNVTEDFLPRSIRVKNKTIADSELEELKQQINKTVKELSIEAAFGDELEQAQFETQLRARLNRGALAAITQGLEFQRRLGEQKMDAEKSARMWSMLSGGIATATSYGVANSGRGGMSGGSGGFSAQQMGGTQDALGSQRADSFGTTYADNYNAGGLA